MKRLALIPVLLLAACFTSRAQSPTAPLCKPAIVDVMFTFGDVPATPGQQYIDVNLHNTTAADCRLKGELGPNFSAQSHGLWIKTSWLRLPDDKPDFEAIKRNDAFLLPANGDAHVHYPWASTGDTCETIEWGNFDTTWDGPERILFDPHRWKPTVCSVMQVSGYLPGRAPALLPASSADAKLTVVPLPQPLYADEFAELTLQLSSPNNVITPTDRCPELYAAFLPGGEPRFEGIASDNAGIYINNISGKSDMSAPPFLDSNSHLIKGYTRVCGTQGKQSITQVRLPVSMEAPLYSIPAVNLRELQHIVWKALDTRTHTPVFVTADTHFTILDPATLPQNWGDKSDGIGVGLSTDKPIYTMGEDIPLHLHWENFNARQKLGVTECGEPRPEVEVQDAAHHVLATVDTMDFCSGHGWGPFELEKGKPNNDFLAMTYRDTIYSLGGIRTPITKPGVYFLVAVWKPLILDNAATQTPGTPRSIREGTLDRPYATARSQPVRIEIKGK